MVKVLLNLYIFLSLLCKIFLQCNEIWRALSGSITENHHLQRSSNGQSVHFCAKHAEMMIASTFERKSQNDLQTDRGLSLRHPTTSDNINSSKISYFILIRTLISNQKFKA